MLRENRGEYLTSSYRVVVALEKFVTWWYIGTDLAMAKCDSKQNASMSEIYSLRDTHHKHSKQSRISVGNLHNILYATPSKSGRARSSRATFAPWIIKELHWRRHENRTGIVTAPVPTSANWDWPTRGLLLTPCRILHDKTILKKVVNIECHHV
jgi:hypothetical protein